MRASILPERSGLTSRHVLIDFLKDGKQAGFLFGGEFGWWLTMHARPRRWRTFTWSTKAITASHATFAQTFTGAHSLRGRIGAFQEFLFIIQ
jgi:hypothetical protein